MNINQVIRNLAKHKRNSYFIRISFKYVSRYFSSINKILLQEIKEDKDDWNE